MDWAECERLKDWRLWFESDDSSLDIWNERIVKGEYHFKKL